MKEKKEEVAKMTFPKSIYSTEAVKRAAYHFLETFYMTITEENEEVIVHIESKKEEVPCKKIVKEFQNCVLQEEIRYNIECETQIIRNRLFEKAMKMKENE